MELELGFQGKNKHNCYQIQVVWQLVCLRMLVQCMSSLVCYGWSECVIMPMLYLQLCCQAVSLQ